MRSKLRIVTLRLFAEYALGNGNKIVCLLFAIETRSSHFANMVLQLPTKSGRTMKDAYEEDVMYYMALLKDDHPNYDQTKENAERLLWELPLKGGPRQPSRKEMIMKGR